MWSKRHASPRHCLPESRGSNGYCAVRAVATPSLIRQADCSIFHLLWKHVTTRFPAGRKPPAERVRTGHILDRRMPACFAGQRLAVVSAPAGPAGRSWEAFLPPASSPPAGGLGFVGCRTAPVRSAPTLPRLRYPPARGPRMLPVRSAGTPGSTAQAANLPGDRDAAGDRTAGCRRAARRILDLGRTSPGATTGLRTSHPQARTRFAVGRRPRRRPDLRERGHVPTIIIVASNNRHVEPIHFDNGRRVELNRLCPEAASGFVTFQPVLRQDRGTPQKENRL